MLKRMAAMFWVIGGLAAAGAILEGAEPSLPTGWRHAAWLEPNYGVEAKGAGPAPPCLEISQGFDASRTLMVARVVNLGYRTNVLAGDPSRWPAPGKVTYITSRSRSGSAMTVKACVQDSQTFYYLWELLEYAPAHANAGPGANKDISPLAPIKKEARKLQIDPPEKLKANILREVGK